MKHKDDLFRAKQDSDWRWKQLVSTAGIVFFFMLLTAHSEAEYKECEENSPAGHTGHVSYPLGFRRLSSQWGDAGNQIVPGIVETGFYVPLRGGLHTGVLITYAKGNGQLNGNGIEMGSTQVALLIGKSWGGKCGPSSTVR